MLNTSSPLAFAAALALGLFVSGCGASLVPFTHELRDQNKLTDDDVKNLQFYLSHKITLRRELESGSRQVTGNHKLLLVSGKSIEEVIIDAKTPGIALAVKPHMITVSFEQGTSLDFVVEGAKPTLAEPVQTAPRALPNPFPGNDSRPIDPPLSRSPDSLFGNYWLWVQPNGRVPFQGTEFDAVDDSGQAHLLIDSDTLKEVAEQRKVLPGLRLPSK